MEKRVNGVAEKMRATVDIHILERRKFIDVIHSSRWICAAKRNSSEGRERERWRAKTLRKATIFIKIELN